MRSALLAGLVLLAACNQTAEDTPETAPAATPVPPSLAKASASVALTCEKDLPITAIYGTNAQGQADVALIIKGQSFSLVETKSTSGARYSTAAGLEPGMGLVWVVNGETALLQQVPSDKVADEAAAQTIKTCKVKGASDAPK